MHAYICFRTYTPKKKREKKDSTTSESSGTEDSLKLSSESLHVAQSETSHLAITPDPTKFPEDDDGDDDGDDDEDDLWLDEDDQAPVDTEGVELQEVEAQPSVDDHVLIAKAITPTSSNTNDDDGSDVKAKPQSSAFYK